jgi:hypothetical protein
MGSRGDALRRDRGASGQFALAESFQREPKISISTRRLRWRAALPKGRLFRSLWS